MLDGKELIKLATEAASTKLDVVAETLYKIKARDSRTQNVKNLGNKAKQNELALTYAFLMNTEEETNANKERENKDQEMASSEEANTTENKENDDPKNKADNMHRKDADQKIVHSETPSWTSKGRSITSPQVWC